MAKFKRTNLGYKNEPCCTVEKKQSSVSYPTFYVQKKLPITKMDVGKTFDAKAKIKCTGLTQRAGEGKNNFDYTFEVRDIQF